MLVINYNGNKPIADHYKYSVSGNNDVDCIRFCLSKEQDGLVLEQDYGYYANVRCVDDDFYDKVLLNNVEIDSEDNSVVVLFYLQKIHTSHKQIEVSLSVESNDDEVWHTQAVKISINNGVDCDDEIVNNYPTILQQLQQQINELSGGIKEVEISKIYLTNDSHENPILVMNKITDVIDGERYTNDPSRVLVVIETTPINTTIEQKIREGVFVIRFNHCVKYSKKGYRHCVGDRLKEFEQGLIFVDEDMITIASNGKKYIKVEMSFLDFYNKFYSLKNYPNTKAINLQSLAQNKYQSILSTIFLYQNGDFDQEYYHSKLGGYPMLKEENFNFLYNTTYLRLYHTSSDAFPNVQNQNPKPKPIGLNTKYNFYSFIFYNGVGEQSRFDLDNYFIRKTRHKYITLFWNGETETYDSDYINRYAPIRTGKLTRRLIEMALQPSCAILNPNYKTMTEYENVWEESFEKSQQTITMSIGSFLYISINNIATRGYLFIPRIRISPKK